MTCCWTLFDAGRKYITHGRWYVLRSYVPGILLLLLVLFFLSFLFTLPICPPFALFYPSTTSIRWGGCSARYMMRARADSGRDQDFGTPLLSLPHGTHQNGPHCATSNDDSMNGHTPPRPAIAFHTNGRLAITRPRDGPCSVSQIAPALGSVCNRPMGGRPNVTGLTRLCHCRSYVYKFDTLFYQKLS